ncbi:MAG: hypothetical protein IPM60_11755 [Rhodospirillales bacterium]|nr:hypothetical protein [Rhodospirillales bacterium]
MVDLVGADIYNKSRTASHEQAQEFCVVSGVGVLVKSGVFAQFMLRQMWDSGVLLGAISSMLRNAVCATADDEEMRYIARDLMRFSMIEGILPPGRRREALIAYYEEIKCVGECQRNQFFWLQYAIARLSLHEYDAARNYLDTAYSLARKIPGFNTRQIDNQYARYLLENATYSNDRARSFSVWLDANKLLLMQMRKEKDNHYPYRVASAYKDYIEHFGESWDRRQIAAFRSACNTVIGNIGTLERHLAAHPHVQQCKAALQTVAWPNVGVAASYVSGSVENLIQLRGPTGRNNRTRIIARL